MVVDYTMDCDDCAHFINFCIFSGACIFSNNSQIWRSGSEQGSIGTKAPSLCLDLYHFVDADALVYGYETDVMVVRHLFFRGAFLCCLLREEKFVVEKLFSVNQRCVQQKTTDSTYTMHIRKAE